jgi:hypothetical protein
MIALLEATPTQKAILIGITLKSAIKNILELFNLIFVISSRRGIYMGRV